MNSKNTIGEHEFTSKDVFSQICAIAIISSYSIANCTRHKILIVGEK